MNEQSGKINETTGALKEKFSSAPLAIGEQKRELRRRIREELRLLECRELCVSEQEEHTGSMEAFLRSDLPPVSKETDAKILENVRRLPAYDSSQTVFCFVGVRREIDTRALIERMLAEGKQVCVPRCGAPGQMEAYVLHSLSELKKGQFGIPEPTEGAAVISPERIDLMLLPCLAVRPDGLRLGQGGGYYDRYMENFHGVSAALCREAFVLEDIPAEVHDRYADFIVTERGVRKCGSV